MPYTISPADGGFYVLGEDGTRKSKKPLTRTMAEKQKIALDIAHARAAGHQIPLPAKRTPRVVSMPLTTYKAEHKRLIKTLESGSPKARRAEAAAQKAEVRERLG